MKRLIGTLLRQYGSDMLLRRDGTDTELRAFLQLVTSKSWQNMERMIDSIGEIPRGQYLYIGPPDIPLRPADRLYFDSRFFSVRRAEPIRYRNEALFIWGLCVEGGTETL